MNKMPSKSQANTYAAVTNYLKALDAAKSDDAATVMRQMKSTKADYFGKPVSIRQNGRVAYDLTVYEVKTSGGIEISMGLLQAGSQDFGGRSLWPRQRG